MIQHVDGDDREGETGKHILYICDTVHNTIITHLPLPNGRHHYLVILGCRSGVPCLTTPTTTNSSTNTLPTYATGAKVVVSHLSVEVGIAG